jgi:hypothetical protein
LRGLAIVLALSAIAVAARPRRITFSVEVSPAGWQAEALTATLRADLADDQLKLAPAGKAAEIAVSAQLAGGDLRYTIVRYGAPLRGTVPLAGLDRRALAGVLKDRLHDLVRTHDDSAQPGPPAEVPPVRGSWLGVVIVLAVLLVAPVLLARRMVAARWRALKMMRGTLVSLGALGLAAIAVVTLGERVPEASGFVVLGGGLAWGALAAVLLPLATPKLLGLHRIEHAELGPVLRVWALAAALRTLGLAIALAVLGAALWGVAVVLEVPMLVAFAVIAPVVGLTVRHVRRGIVEILAERLDAELVDGDATAAQPWHPEVRGYFVGYLRRANLEVDEERLEGVRFLPGKGDAVAIYGGGLTHTRIVIGRALLELALAPYGRPHDYPMPRVSTLHWTHWNAGLVMPTEAGEKLATTEQRKPAETTEEGEHERIALGEPPTMSGVIEPVAFDPRTSYRPGEDPLWLDWDPGEEFDGTDAGDKDFLFGILIHAFGMIDRHEDRGATLALGWRHWLAQRAAARMLATITAPVRNFSARRTAALADTHAALNGASHHLAQYLAWRMWRRDDLLTPRAFVPELERASRAIYTALDREADVDESDRRKPPERGARSNPEGIAEVDRWRDRLAGLRMFTTGAPPKRSQRQRLAVAFAVLAGVTAVAVLVVQAVLYHSVYEQRMSQQERPADGNRP